MIEFRYHVIKEELVSCDSCSSEAPLHDFGNTFGRAGKRLMCEMCAATFIGNHNVDPKNVEQYSHEQILICIAQVGNLLLDKLTSRVANALDDAIELPPESDGDDP